VRNPEKGCSVSAHYRSLGCNGRASRSGEKLTESLLCSFQMLASREVVLVERSSHPLTRQPSMASLTVVPEPEDVSTSAARLRVPCPIRRQGVPARPRRHGASHDTSSYGAAPFQAYRDRGRRVARRSRPPGRDGVGCFAPSSISDSRDTCWDRGGARGVGVQKRSELGLFSGPPGSRTRHLGIKSPLLYPMS